MAMSGLLLAGASVALAAHHYRQVQRRFFEVKRRLVVHKAHIKATESEVDTSKKATADLKRQLLELLESPKLARPDGSIEASVAHYEGALASIQETVAVNAKALAQHSVDIAELEADTGELEVLSAELKTLTRISLSGVALGASLVGAGFFLWYTRVQVLLDQALAIQSTLPK
jgi:hypothetical protein